MSFPNLNFDHQELEHRVNQVIDSHGEQSYVMDKGAREMRDDTENGVMIQSYEIPYMQKMVIERAKSLAKNIKDLKDSLSGALAPNRMMAEDKLLKLEKEYDFLQHNFAEKFFQKRNEDDHK